MPHRHARAGCARARSESRPSKGCFATMKSFREAALRARFDTAQAHEAEKRVFREPMLRALRAEVLQEQFGLAPRQSSVELNKEIRQPQIAVELRDFIFQD